MDVNPASRDVAGDQDEPCSSSEADEGEPPPDHGDRSPRDASPIEVHLSEAVARRHGEAIDAPRLRRCLAAALVHLDRSVRRVTVRVVDDEAMIGYHRAYRGDATTTDVLSFEWHEDADAEIEVDIAVCADLAAARVACDGDLERELLRYALHGVLHCAGHDDRTAPQAAAMHAEEDRLLAAIGTGAGHPAACGEAAP